MATTESTEKRVVVQGLCREDLDRQSCAVPGCTEKHHHGALYLHGRCHPAKPSIVKYWWGGVLEVRCKICNKWIMNVFVAPEEQARMDAHLLSSCGPSCGHPQQDHVAILRGGNCHPRAGVRVAYFNGNVTIACAKCNEPLNEIHVKHAAGQA